MDGLPSVANRKHGAIFSQADRRNCMRGRIVGLYRECTGKWTCSSRALFQDSFWGMIAAAVESRASPIFVAFVIARGEIVDRDQTDALANSIMQIQRHRLIAFQKQENGRRVGI